MKDVKVMAYKRVIFLFCTISLLIGCGTPSTMESPNDNNVELTKLTTEKESINQEASNKAKDIIQQYDDITAVNAVNSSNHLIASFEVEYLQRFNLEDIRGEIEKQLKEEFPTLKVVVSTDQKIIIELEKLETELNKNSISKKQLEKNVKKIISLSKEET